MTKWLKDVWAKTWVNVGTKIIVGLWAAFWAADVAAGGVLSSAVWDAFSRAQPETEQPDAPPPAGNFETLWEALLSHEHSLEPAPVGLDPDAAAELEALLVWWREGGAVESSGEPLSAPTVTVRPRIEINPPAVPVEVTIEYKTPEEPPQAPAAPPEIRWPGWLR